MRWRLASVAVVIAAAFTGPPAARASALANYDLDATAWNGISSLALVADHAGFQLDQASFIDVDTRSTSAPLLLIHPTEHLPVEALVAWVRRGGRLLVADDFGAAEPLLHAFGLERVSAPAQELTFDDNVALPIVTPVGHHALTVGVSSVILNHPSALRGLGVPALAFDDGSGLLYDVTLGDGVAVFLSDPSVFTNLMLPLRENGRLARNVLRRLCGEVGSTCSATIVSQGDQVWASGVLPKEQEPTPLGLRERITDALERARSSTIDPRAVRAIVLLLAAGSIALLLTIFPYRAEPTRRPVAAGSSRARSEFEHGVRRYVGPRRQASFAPLGVLLRERALRVLGTSLGTRIDGELSAIDADRGRLDGAVQRWARGLEPSASPRRRREIERTLRELVTLGPTPRDRSRARRWLSQRAYRRVARRALALLGTLEAPERETGSRRSDGEH